jgi:hypothetical protein
MRQFVFLLFILMVFACKQKAVEKISANTLDVIFTSKMALDTLMTYQHEAIPFHKGVFPNYFFDIDTINSCKYAILGQEYGVFYAFIRKNNHWEEIELDSSMIWDISPLHTSKIDINGDGYLDICLSNRNGAYGGPLKFYMLYYSKEQTFKVNRYFDVMEEFDKKSGLVRYHSISPHLVIKGTCKIVGDSLVKLDDIWYGESEYFTEYKLPENYRGAVTRHLKYKNGKPKLFKLVINQDTSNQAHDYFENVLWKLD